MDSFTNSYQPEIDILTSKLTTLNESKEPNQSTISVYETDLLFYQKLERRRLQLIDLRQKIQLELALIETESIQEIGEVISEMTDFEDEISLHGKNAKDVFQGQAGNNHYTVIQKLIYDHSKISKKAEGLFDVCF